MDFELPSDHPLAKAIRHAVHDFGSGHLFLDLTSFGPARGTSHELRLEICRWVDRGRTADREAHMTVTTFDWFERQRAIEAMTTWPTIEPKEITDEG